MNIKQKVPYFGRRCIVLCVSLAIMAFGVAFSIKSNLGTSPISSLPYVLSLFTPLTVGTATIAMHCVLVSLQIIILRKNYHPFQLLQLPVAFLFGYLTDFSIWAIQSIEYTTYWQQWLLCIIGIILIALGVSLEVLSKVVTLAGEGLILAVCQVAPIKFGNMKVVFDVTLVVTACILAVFFTGGIKGVREGTVAAAIFVGLLTKQINRPLKHFEDRYLS